MLGAFGYIHQRAYRLLVWLLLLPLRAVWSLLGALVALLGEEVKRWLGILVLGAMILGIMWTALKVFPSQRLVLLAVLFMGMTWLFGVFRAAQLTMANRVWKVRQRQMFRQLSGEVGKLGERLPDMMAQATWGTPVEGAFKVNRRRTEQARQAEAAAEAERAADDRRRDELAALEPDPYTWEHA